MAITHFGDRCEQISVSTGTGALALGAAPTGFRALLSSYSVGEDLPYCIEGRTAGDVPNGEFETGRGHVDGGGNLIRDTVFVSSNGGAPVNFSAPSLRVFVTASSSALTEWLAGNASAPSIGGGITGGTAGSVLFVGAGATFAQDNANLFWNNTTKRLGIGGAPSTNLDVKGTNADSEIWAENTGAANTSSLIAWNTTTNSRLLARAFGSGVGSTFLGVNRASAVALQVDGSTSAFLFGSIGTQPLVFGTNNVEALRVLGDQSITATGPVAIGKTGVGGTLTLARNSDGAATGTLRNFDIGGGIFELQFINSNGAVALNAFGGAADNTVKFLTNNTERARFLPTGELYINTTVNSTGRSPYVILQTNNAHPDMFWIRNTDSAFRNGAHLCLENDVNAEFRMGIFGSAAVGTVDGVTAAGLACVNVTDHGLLVRTATANPLVFSTNATERMRIAANGVQQNTNDITINDGTKGLVLKDTQGTPHYWRITVNNAGALVITDIGTTAP